jgi:FkbM family methyltransferase
MAPRQMKTGDGIPKEAHMLRTTLENASRRLVFRRRLPPPFAAARIYASTEGGLRYLRPRAAGIDPPLLSLAAELVQPGDTVWDIGANLGLFTFAAAAAAGPAGEVLAVEPDARLVTLLRRSAAANPNVAPVSVLGTAVADEIGVARFHVARRNRSTSYLDGFGTSQTGGSREVQTVPTVTLDWLAERFPAPAVIKIDVEGAEVLVLRGAEQLLRQGATVICEVAGTNAAAVRDVLGPIGYELYDGDVGPARRVPVSAAPPSTLAVHPARLAAAAAG